MNETDFLHRLSNPVTVGVGMLESAIRKAETGATQDALEKMQFSLNSLQEVIELIQNRKLEISSIESDSKS